MENDAAPISGISTLAVNFADREAVADARAHVAAASTERLLALHLANHQAIDGGASGAQARHLFYGLLLIQRELKSRAATP